MKKNIYSMFLAVIALVGFNACSDSDNDYQWADVPTNAQVYFSKDLPTQQNISNKTNSFTIPVSRVKTDEAISVGISLTSDDDFLSAPASVTFAAGQATANVTLSYDPEALVYDQFKSATLTITDANYTTPYGASSYTFKAGVLSPYASIGTGYLVEDYLFGYSCNVTIMQNQENPAVFRIYGASAPIDGGSASEYLEITVCKPGDTFRGVTVTQNDLVYFEDYNTGYYHSSYEADIMLYHPSKFTATNPEEFWLYNRVLAYQEDGTPGQIQLAPRYYMDGVGGWNASQTDGAVVITFPGYTPMDYSAELAASGIFTDLAGNVFAQAIVALGADATIVKAVVVDADADPEAVADAIVAGELETTDVEDGVINVPIPEGASGKLQIVLVVLDEEGAAKTICASGFEYYGGAASPWQSIGIGLYTEDFISSVFDADPVTYEVEIEEVEGNIAKVNVNGIPFEVELQKPINAAKHPTMTHPKVEAPKAAVPTPSPAAAPIQQPAATSGSGTPMKAPLPGTITEVKVAVGQQVNVGDIVLVLEAMKMQNNIEAEYAGTITSIIVKPGDTVMEGSVLLTIG